MKKKITLSVFALFFTINLVLSQVQQNTYELNSLGTLLTNDVKGILDTNLKDKRVVFLGESNHYSGSDLLAKTEFVKYLVLEKGYKDIAFEADFFGLYFDHNQKYLYPFWSNSFQCQELFKILKEQSVTIWGFDNQLNSAYSSKYFSEKLDKYLHQKEIKLDKKFINLTDQFFKNIDKTNTIKIVGKSNLDYLFKEIENLLKNDKINEDKYWTNFLESYKSYIQICSTKKSPKKGIPLRDTQMSKNLDVLIKSLPEKKFIVWLHNAHMIKDDYGTREGQTMGFQFVKLNPNISYHIAFTSINMPFRKPKIIEQYRKDKENLLYFLPTIDKNYFVDSQKILSQYPKFGENVFKCMFDVTNDELKTNWFQHYDAFVFIAKGEDVKFIK